MSPSQLQPGAKDSPKKSQPSPTPVRDAGPKTGRKTATNNFLRRERKRQSLARRKAAPTSPKKSDQGVARSPSPRRGSPDRPAQPSRLRERSPTPHPRGIRRESKYGSEPKASDHDAKVTFDDRPPRRHPHPDQDTGDRRERADDRKPSSPRGVSDYNRGDKGRGRERDDKGKGKGKGKKGKKGKKP